MTSSVLITLSCVTAPIPTNSALKYELVAMRIPPMFLAILVALSKSTSMTFSMGSSHGAIAHS